MCTYLRRALFQSMISEVGIAMATQIFGLAVITFWKSTFIYICLPHIYYTYRFLTHTHVYINYIYIYIRLPPVHIEWSPIRTHVYMFLPHILHIMVAHSYTVYVNYIYLAPVQIIVPPICIHLFVGSTVEYWLRLASRQRGGATLAAEVEQLG